MVRKLIADELFYFWREWRIVFLPAAIVFLVSGVGFATNLPFIATLAVVTVVLSLLAIFLSPPVFLLLRYYRTLYGKEGYLTMTLPVLGRDIYIAKAVAAFILLTANVACLFLFLIIFSLSIDFRQNQKAFVLLRQLFNFATGQPNISLICVLVVGYILFSIFILICQFSFVISKGSEARFHSFGVGGPVIVYLLTYVVQQVLSLAGMLLIPLSIAFPLNLEGGEVRLVFSSSLDYFKQTLSGTVPAELNLGLGFFLTLFMVSILYFVLTIRSIERKTDLR